jgi:hypothetical protein
LERLKSLQLSLTSSFLQPHNPQGIAARSQSGFGGRGENLTVRGPTFADLEVHSGAMDQESAEIWTAQTESQAGQPKSDRLLGLRAESLQSQRQPAADVGPFADQDAVADGVTQAAVGAPLV